MVDIHFGEGDMAFDGMVIGELREDWGDGAAGWAPVGVKVDYNIGGGRQEGVELGRIGDFVDIP